MKFNRDQRQSPPGRAEALTALVKLQVADARALSTVAATGDINYEKIGAYLPIGRQYLHESVAYEEKWPGSIELHTVAGPLVQQLSIYADWLESGGNRRQAEELRAEADDIAGRFLSPEQMAAHTRGRAMDVANSGKFNVALMGLEAAQQAFLDAGRPIEAAQTMSQAANVYEWLGDFSRALSRMDDAQDLVAEELAGGPPSSRAVGRAVINQFANILSGRPNRVGEDAMSLRRLHYELVQGRARVNRRLGRYDEARRLWEEARPFVESAVPAGIDFHLAAIAVDTGDAATADQLLQRIAPEFDKGLMRPRRGALRLLQADVALLREEPARSLAAAEHGLAEQETYPDLDLAWKLHWRKARALSQAGDRHAALLAFRRAVEAADTLRLVPLGYVLDTLFVADKVPMFEEAIDLAVALGDGVAAAHFVELVKGRALAAVLSTPPVPGSAEDPDTALFEDLSQQADAIAFKVYSGEASDEDVRRREDLLRRRREVVERIRIRDPRWRSLTVPPAVDIDAVLRLLREADRAAMVLHLRRDRLVAVLLAGGEAVVGETVFDASTAAALQDFEENLRAARADSALFDLSDELGVGLRDLLPEVVADAVAADSRPLLVVPHGLLHLLPWAAIRLDEERLYSTRPVGVLPNLAAFTQLGAEVTTPAKVALLGDPDYTGLEEYYPPLDWAGAELTDLADMYGSNGLLAPVKQRGEARQDVLEFLLGLGGPGALLHVACHADIDADEPLASGLILTGSTLDAAEILRRGCSYPEVVLSACSTGWRPQSPHGLNLAGDDVLGLVASFLEAGARSLLVSITPAQDAATRRFMIAWHGHRRAGATPLQALQRTQLQMERAAEPVDTWAGITAFSSH